MQSQWRALDCPASWCGRGLNALCLYAKGAEPCCAAIEEELLPCCEN